MRKADTRSMRLPFPDVSAKGKRLIEEALTNIREAIELYLEPVEDNWLVEERGFVRELG